MDNGGKGHGLHFLKVQPGILLLIYLSDNSAEGGGGEKWENAWK